MAESIWKYDVPISGDDIWLAIPSAEAPLCVQVQHEVPRLWIVVDPSWTGPCPTRRFRWVGTGWALPAARKDLSYVGTVQTRGGALVFHLFEVH